MERVFIQFMTAIRIGRDGKFLIPHIYKVLRIIEPAPTLHFVTHTGKGTIAPKYNLVCRLLPEKRLIPARLYSPFPPACAVHFLMPTDRGCPCLSAMSLFMLEHVWCARP